MGGREVREPIPTKKSLSKSGRGTFWNRAKQINTKVIKKKRKGK